MEGEGFEVEFLCAHVAKFFDSFLQQRSAVWKIFPIIFQKLENIPKFVCFIV
jgi:hypothetical protein